MRTVFGDAPCLKLSVDCYIAVGVMVAGWVGDGVPRRTLWCFR